jgi:hypothetical protein
MPFDGTNVTTPAQKALLKARSLIENGWCQGQFAINTETGTQYCILGAIQMTVNGDPLKNAEYSASPRKWSLENYMRVALQRATNSNRHLEQWNDMRSRRKSHVLAAFDVAISKAVLK